MSKFQRYMYLIALGNGADLPRDLVEKVIYGDK